MKEETNQQIIHTIHKMIEETRDIDGLLNNLHPRFGNGGILHYFIKFKEPKPIAYLLCRGHDVIIDGIDCKTLQPIRNIDLPNGEGKTAFQVASGLGLRSTDIDDQTKMKLILDYIRLAKAHQFDRISDRLDSPEATYNAARNAIMSAPTASDIDKEESPAKLSLDSAQFHEAENEMPHYPSFDREWKIRDDSSRIKRSAFLEAYNNNNFSGMERAILRYNIEFKGSDTISELAYEAIDKGCLTMAQRLIEQGSAAAEYTPQGQTVNLSDKLSHARALETARREATESITTKRPSSGMFTPYFDLPEHKKQKSGRDGK